MCIVAVIPIISFVQRIGFKSSCFIFLSHYYKTSDLTWRQMSALHDLI